MFFERLDRNRDGRLDGDEISQAGPFQSFLERAGIREGASREDFSRGFDRLRQERENGDRNGDGRSRNNQSSGYTPAKRERVTLDLPDSFADRDADGDGQIGLYEWREWDRTRVDEFFFLDRNGDGFITPKELAAFSGGDDRRDNSGRSSSARPETREISRVSVTVPPPSPPPSTAPAQLDENDANVRKGRDYFKLLDSNGDGTATAAELARIQKMRPMFEKAGIRLDQDMTADQFTSNYVKAVQASEAD